MKKENVVVKMSVKDQAQLRRKLEKNLNKMDTENRNLLETFFQDNYTLKLPTKVLYALITAELVEKIRKPLREMTEEDAKRFMRNLVQEGKKATTINTYGTKMKKFFRWMNKKIFDWWKPQKMERGIKDRLISIEDFNKLIDTLSDGKRRTLLATILLCCLYCSPWTCIPISCWWAWALCYYS